MNPFIEPTVIVAVWWLITTTMLWMENRIKLVSALVPSEAHAFGLLILAVFCTMIVRSIAHGGLRLPSVRRMVMPQPKHRYAQRTRRVV